VTKPRFIVDTDNGDVWIEDADGPTDLEGYDIDGVIAFTIDGERLNPVAAGGKPSGDVTYQPTGEIALAELESRVRSYLARSGPSPVNNGDFLVDAANAIAAVNWERRWPRRPRWLSRSIHGDAPPRFGRS
jgi:hypothetical protein